MGLHDAVQDIVDRMQLKRDKHWENHQEDTVITLLLDSYIEQLKTALKASEGNIPSPTIPVHDDLSATAFHHRMIEQARLEMKKNKTETEINGEEDAEPSQRECVGGPAHGDLAVISSTMPLHAKMYVMGVVYQLREDNKLHVMEETKSTILLP